MLSCCPLSAAKALENRRDYEPAREGESNAHLGAFLDHLREGVDGHLVE
jgi:hypothetical protein